MLCIKKILRMSLIILYLILILHIFAEDEIQWDQLKSDIMDINKTEEGFNKLITLQLSRDENIRNRALDIVYDALKSDNSTIRDKAFNTLLGDCRTRVIFKRKPDERFKPYLIEAVLKRNTQWRMKILGPVVGYFKLTKEEIDQLLAASDQYKDHWGEHEMILRGIAKGGGMDTYEPFIRHFNIDVKSTDSLNRYEKYFLLMNDEDAINRFLNKMQSPELRNRIEASHFAIISQIISKRVEEFPNEANIGFGIKYIKLLKTIIEDKESKDYLIDSALCTVSDLGTINTEFKSLAKPILVNNSDKWINSHAKDHIEINLKEMDHPTRHQILDYYNQNK